MWKLVERNVPDFVEAACPFIIQIVWCWQWVQFSQVIVLIFESVKILILQNYYMCMCVCVQLYTP